MHRDNSGIRRKYQCANVLRFLFIHNFIMPEREKVVDKEYESTKEKIGKVKGLSWLKEAKKKNSINKMEKSIVESKEKGSKDFDSGNRQNCLVINCEFFG